MKLGILGYGNLARGVEVSSIGEDDIEISAVFTRRNPEKIKTLSAPVYHEKEVGRFVGKLDCLLICRGSATDLPRDTPRYSELFDTVDTYDNHTDIERHIERVGTAVGKRGGISVVSVGWDPGFLSLMRLYFTAFSKGRINTFWGEGISQGHTQALYSIEGLSRAVQYTLPKPEALSLARAGEILSNTDRHKRRCYIVPKKNTPEERERIEKEIRSLENYFSGYDTEVIFINEEEFEREHTGLYHRGRVISRSDTGLYREHPLTCTLDLEIGSNPEFTASIMLASARALYRMKKEGRVGVYTLFDLPPSYLLPLGKKGIDLL